MSVLSTEAELQAMGADDVSERLVRTERVVERARGLVAVLTERRRSIEREQGRPSTPPSSPRWSRSRPGWPPSSPRSRSEATRLAPDAERLAEEEQVLAARAGRLRRPLEARARRRRRPAPSGAAAEVRGELGALRAAVERSTTERQRADSRLEAIEAKLTRLGEEADRPAPRRPRPRPPSGR